MPIIGDLGIGEFKRLIDEFDKKYVRHWESWLASLENEATRTNEFARILRSWQAFRPNIMRRPQSQAVHEEPYLETIIANTQQYIDYLEGYDLGEGRRFTTAERDVLSELWNELLPLSLEGKKKTKRHGLAGVVGISKAVLLLTKGAVGPALDSQVRKRLCICEPINANQWANAIELASQDAHQFQVRNKCTLQEAAQEHCRNIKPGRIYDMALGPRAKNA